jgi:prophage antirepressor-like protein
MKNHYLQLRIFEIANVTMALKNIPDKWKGVKKFLTPSGPQEMLYVNEAGLYKFVMRSNKPVAEKFQEWVCEEVLPSLRKKGEYVLEEYKIKLKEQQKQLDSEKKKTEEQQDLIEKKDERIKKLQRETQVVKGSQQLRPSLHNLVHTSQKIKLIFIFSF